MGQNELATRLETAIENTLRNKNEVTADLGGKASTQQFTDNIIRNIEKDAVHLETVTTR